MGDLRTRKMSASLHIQVPPGTVAGSVINVATPDGQTIPVQIPAGAGAGTTLSVPYEPQGGQGPVPVSQSAIQTNQHQQGGGAPSINTNWPGGNNFGCDCYSGPGLKIYDSILTHDPEALVGGYRDGLCSCFNKCSLCCNACFCYPCTVGQVWSKLIGGHKSCCATACLMVALMFIPYIGGLVSTIFGIVIMCQLLPVFYRRYQIPKHEQGNCCTIVFCHQCHLSQVARHMEDYERHPEKNVFCECCSETLDVPNPPNYLWVQQQQVCAPAAQVMMVPQQAPAYVPQTNQGVVKT